MTRRAMVTFHRYSDPKQQTRLFIRDGVVMNPQAETNMQTDADDWSIYSLRRTGEALRILEHIPSE
jgi:hypothetical protein